MTLPESITPAEFARRYGWSERRVRREARKLGACRILGNRMVLLLEDTRTILEATKCPSPSIGAAKSGTSGGRLPATDYEARLAQRAARSQRALRPRKSTTTTNVVSMDRRKS